MNKNRYNGHMLIIIGISSKIGTEVAKRYKKKNYDVVGTYRKWNKRLEEIRKDYEENDRKIELVSVDVLKTKEIEILIDNEIKRKKNVKDIVILYCCGLWRSGLIGSEDEEKFEEIVGVGLKAPYLLASIVKRKIKTKFKIIIVTGIGGEKSSVYGNALYSICSNGIYSIVKAMGMELAGTKSNIVGIALGLYDKGQPYIYELCSQLNIKRPGDIRIAAEFISLIIEKTYYESGSVIELTDGLFNYYGVTKNIKEKNRNRKKGKPTR